MIHEQDLPMSLWEKACNTSINIQNQCPQGILEYKTPKEAFTSVKSKANPFHIFGCPIYIHVLIEKRTKLEPFNKKGSSVGYHETWKAFKVYIPKQSKALVSKDVEFEEDFTSKKSHEPILVSQDEEREAPKGKQMVSSKRLYKIKNTTKGSIEKFKARFMLWGFS